MTLPLIALLLVVLGLLAWRAITRERGPYRRFKRLTSTRARQRVYARWLLESVLVMGGLTAVVLLGSWSYVPLALRDTQSWAPVAGLRAFLGTPLGAVVVVVAALLVIALLIAPVLLLRASARETGAGTDAIPAVGDIRALLPRTRSELKFGAGLGLQAGVFEELLFRLALPALLFGIVGNGPLAFAIATLVFGALHLYQKLPGILVALVLGVVFAGLYVVSGSIALPIVLHAAVDLRSLVLIPLAVGQVWRVRGD